MHIWCPFRKKRPGWNLPLAIDPEPEKYYRARCGNSAVTSQFRSGASRGHPCGSAASLGPCQTISPAPGVDQLHTPVVDLNCRHLMALVAGNICELTVRSDHHLLRSRGHTDRLDDLQRREIDDRHGICIRQRY